MKLEREGVSSAKTAQSLALETAVSKFDLEKHFLSQNENAI